jgi:hypothetical protein
MHISWNLTGDGLATLAAGIIAFCAVWWQVSSTARNLRKQLSAEKSTREEDLKRERFGTAAVLRSEVFSIWEVDLRPLSSAMRKVPEHTGTSLLTAGLPLPAAPNRYFPVFEHCAANVGLLDWETVSLAVQFYKRVSELLLAWGEYNRDSTRSVERFKGLHERWEGLHDGYRSLIARLEAEMGTLH